MNARNRREQDELCDQIERILTAINTTYDRIELDNLNHELEQILVEYEENRDRYSQKS